MKIFDYIFPQKRFVLVNGKEVLQSRSKTPLIIILLIAMIALSVKVTGFDFEVLIERGKEFFIVIGRMFPPDWSYMDKVWTPIFDTIKMSLLGLFIGSISAVPIAILASSNIVKNKFILSVSRLFLSIVRTLPTLVIALIATYVFGLGTFAGTVAISIYTFAFVGKKLYEQIETVDMGAYDALQAIGASRPRSFFNAIIPQVLPSYLATCLLCFEGSVRHAAILGYVGAGGIGLILSEKLALRDYNKVGLILVTIFVVIIIIETIRHFIRKKLM